MSSSTSSALDRAITRLLAVMNARDWDLAGDIERTSEYVEELELEVVRGRLQVSFHFLTRRSGFWPDG